MKAKLNDRIELNIKVPEKIETRGELELFVFELQKLLKMYPESTSFKTQKKGRYTMRTLQEKKKIVAEYKACETNKQRREVAKKYGFPSVSRASNFVWKLKRDMKLARK